MPSSLELAEIGVDQVAIPMTGREPDRELIASIRRFGVLFALIWPIRVIRFAPTQLRNS